METFTIRLKDIDLQQYIDFQSVFVNPVPGSKVYFIFEVARELITQILDRDSLPIPFNSLVEMVNLVCQDRKIEIHRRFIKEVIRSYLATDERVILNQDRSALIFRR